MHTLLFGLFVGYFLTACAPVHWSSARLAAVAGVLWLLLLSLGRISAKTTSTVTVGGTTTRGQRQFLVFSCLQFAFGCVAATLALGLALERVGSATNQANKTCGHHSLVMRVRIEGLPVAHAAGSRFNARVIDISEPPDSSLRDCSFLEGRRLRLGMRGLVRLWPGQTLVAQVALRPIRGSVSPGAFDHELHSAMNGVVLGGYVVQAFALRDGDHNPMQSLFNIDRYRYALRSKLAQQDLRYAGVVLALATGDSAVLRSEDWALLRDSGTVHLMVISGLHVGLVSGILFLLFRWAAGFFQSLRQFSGSSAGCTALLTSAATYLYVQWVGAGVPATRAWLMVTVVLFGWAINRRVQPVTLVLFAAIGVVAVEPLAGLRAGFWLSFALVAWLLAAPTPQVAWSPNEGWDAPGKGYAPLVKGFALVLSLAKLHVGATIVLLPLLVWLGLPLAPASPLANLFAVPFVTLLLVPLILLWLLVLPVSTAIADRLLVIADQLVEWLFFALQQVVVFVSAISLPVVSLEVLAALLFLALVLLLSSSVYVRGSVALVLAIWVGHKQLDGSAPGAARRDDLAFGEFSVQMLDVGQGLAVIVKTKDAVLLYDTGASFPSGFSFAESVIVPALQRAGIKQLDALVVSHGDNDHAGGVKQITQIFSPRRTAGLAGDTCAWKSAAVNRRHWTSAGVEFVLLSDPEGVSSNDRSCVLWVRSPQAQALLAGDIESSAERRLLNRFPVGVDLLSVAHHGSNTSSAPEFVAQLQPGWALVSAGYRNRFGHPHAEVVDRFRSVGAAVVTTAEAGTMTWRSSDVGGLTSARRMRRSEWRLGVPLILILEQAH